MGRGRRVALVSCNGFNMEADEVCDPPALVGFDGVAGVGKVEHKRATTEAPVSQHLILPQVQNLQKMTMMYHFTCCISDYTSGILLLIQQASSVQMTKTDKTAVSLAKETNLRNIWEAGMYCSSSILLFSGYQNHLPLRTSTIEKSLASCSRF